LAGCVPSSNKEGPVAWMMSPESFYIETQC
jgi:hypothetical protein